ncbi:hypothetical protein [Fibrobacter sp. UWB11]|uniref:hypothetical protein n=1 Tax=Fibrobacter sp. UWB11 TaxID=1896202 RepID=UPI00092CCF3A|nr:hypothetical protein [Fibrobacter sp. UWB11]SIO08142.1 hypothetical protein SAMN05720758_1321 [Fibrobacter sp. UWB11]
MKIEKKKVTGNSRLSSATKVGVASVLGMSTVFMSGCLSDAESGQVMGPANEPNSSDASQTPEIQSSSSVADIPLSHERLSSEAIEVLSSSSVQTPSSSPVAPIQSSSSEEIVSSSSESSSSTFVEKPRSSSSVKEESSSSTEVVPPWPRDCNKIDSMGVNVIMCHDDDDFPLVSMVSTYEMFDNV